MCFAFALNCFSIQAKSSLKKEPSRAEDEETWGLADASSGASEVNASGANSLSEASRRAHDEHHAVLACHTCPDLDDQSLFPDKVIENIVTANMEAKQLLRQLRSPLACGNFDKASQIHAFIERFAHLTDICSPAAHAAKLKLEKIPAKGVENWLESRASAGGAESSMAAARAARESRVALEESVRAVWREARQLCGTMGCHLPQPLPARQSEVNKSCSWDEQLRGIERALRECNRACRDSGIGIDDAGLAVTMRAAHGCNHKDLTVFCQWNPADDSGTCRAKLEQALNERRSLLLVNKKLIQDHRQQQQVQQQQEELPKLPDEETAVYIAKLERCVAALSLKCNLPNPFQAN